MLVANYGGGSAAVLPVDEDGKLGEASSFVQHKGSSVDKGRQNGPHAHSVNLDAANKFAVVADLGLDKVLVYKFDSGRGQDRRRTIRRRCRWPPAPARGTSPSIRTASSRTSSTRCSRR